MHAKHKGHEAMHAEMVLILIVTLVVAQLVLVQWKQRHPKSYNVSHTKHLLSNNLDFMPPHFFIFKLFIFKNWSSIVIRLLFGTLDAPSFFDLHALLSSSW